MLSSVKAVNIKQAQKRVMYVNQVVNYWSFGVVVI